MKKITLVLTAAMLASTAMADGINMVPRHRIAPAGKSINFSTAVDFSKATILTSDPRESRSASDVITDPGCEAISYKTYYKGFQAYMGDCFPASGMAITNVAYGRNNDVYIQDIVSSYSTGSYVKAKFDLNFDIRVDFPQTVFFMDFGEGNVYEIEANLLKFTYNDVEDGVNINYEIAEDNYVTYSVDQSTGVLTLNLPEWEVPTNPTADNLFEYAIGLTSPYEYQDENGQTIKGFYWLACADVNQTKEYFGQYSAYVPDGVAVEEWAMVADNNYSIVNVAIDQAESQIYVVGLNEFDPAAAIVGTIDGDKVAFKAPQYMGWCSMFGVPVYFCTGELAEDGYNINMDTFNAAFVFDYDAENKVMTSTNHAQCLIENGAEEYSYPFRTFQNPTIKLQKIEETYASPRDPSLIDCMPFDPDKYEGYIIWDIPSINVESALIPTNLMYYNLYMDGELFPLSPEEYFMVDTYMEDIPYNYTDGWDINIGGSTHWIYYYIDGVETMGVQSFYAADNGKTYSSNLITYNLETGETDNEGGSGETSGIQAVENAQIASVYYSNLMGQRVANPESGLYVKTVVMTDGSVKSFKVMVRK